MYISLVSNVEVSDLKYKILRTAHHARPTICVFDDFIGFTLLAESSVYQLNYILDIMWIFLFVF